ncbi:unnamed protein product, partial [Acanthocheilonema viteae]
MSGNSSHSHSTHSRRHLRSTTSGSSPSSHQTVSEASDNSTRTSQHTISRNSPRSRSSHRAAQHLSSPQNQEIERGSTQNTEQEAVQLDQSERHSPVRSQLTESSALHYGSDLDTSSQVGSTISWQRTVRHMRPDINCAPSQHRTVCIDSME